MPPETARAAVAAEGPASAGAATRITRLRSGWPLMLRATVNTAPTPITEWASRRAQPAFVHVAAGGAGPVGGDRWHLQVRLGHGSALILSEVSPTLLLPGPSGAESRLDVDIQLGPGATLAWLPQLAIAARGCRHRTEVHIAMSTTARLLLREAVVFGRHGERPGELHQRTRIVTDDRPLYDQELSVGCHASAWDGPAVTAGERCAGSLILVDPERSTDAVDDDLHSPDDGPAAAMTLPGHGLLVTALAPDATALHRRLAAGLTRLLQ